VSPVYVFAVVPLRVRLPVPENVTAPAPLMTPANACVVGWLIVSDPVRG